MLNRTLLTIGVLALVGCGQGEKASRTNDLAFDRNAKNVLLNFGAPTNLAGVPVDIQKNDQLFREGGFGFEVVSVNKATKAMILDNTRRHAAAVSETGTLFWYFSGHGVENGSMLTEDQNFITFREVAEAIKSVRQTPLKRMLVVIDNCFSGTNIDAVIPGSGLTLTGEEYEEGAAALSRSTRDSAVAGLQPIDTSYSSGLYEQALVFTASTAQQTSLDGATGGVFSNAWRETLQSLKASNPNATIRDMVNGATAATTRSSGGHHTPLHKALPSEAVLGDSLFNGGTRPSTPNGQTTNPEGPANPAGPSTNPTDPTNPTGPSTNPTDPANPAGPTTPETGLAVAVSTPDAEGYALIQITAPAAAARAGLCAGDEATCRASLKDEFLFKKDALTGADGRKTFAMLGAAKLEAGKKYTALAFDAAGQLLAAKEIATAP